MTKRILCVDDNKSMCRTLSFILERKGYSVTTAMDGEEALERFRERDYDLSLIDIKLPGPDGVETLKMLRKEKPDALVIMMTAYAVEDKVKEAMDEGISAVFYKPMDMDLVIRKIEDAIGKGEEVRS